MNIFQKFLSAFTNPAPRTLPPRVPASMRTRPPAGAGTGARHTFLRTAPVYGSDRIALVVFNDDGKPLAVPAKPFAPWLQSRIQQLPLSISGNCTNLAAGFDASIKMLQRTPPGIQRRIWLLSDGLPNRDTARIQSLVRIARDSHININTVQFGDNGHANAQLLKTIANGTHNGTFYRIGNLRDLKHALMRGSKRIGPTRRHHRSETTVFCIDTSGSMLGSMEGRRKIDVVVEALLILLEYKQKTWS